MSFKKMWTTKEVKEAGGSVKFKETGVLEKNVDISYNSENTFILPKVKSVVINAEGQFKDELLEEDIVDIITNSYNFDYFIGENYYNYLNVEKTDERLRISIWNKSVIYYKELGVYKLVDNTMGAPIKYYKWSDAGTFFDKLTNNVMIDTTSVTINYNDNLTPVDKEQFEELVKVTPTEVSIIEDEGKLELMLEHDGEVLAVNDTPNQFLQRRLDKPSAEWNSETSSEDFGTWLEEHTTYVGQIAEVSHPDDSAYCIIVDVSAGSYTLAPITISRFNDADTNSHITTIISINPSTNRLSFFGFDGNKETSILDIDKFKLF